jgi:hypothetical protein
MHLSPAAIEGAIRLLDQRGNVTRFGDIGKYSGDTSPANTIAFRGNICE